MLLRDHSWGRRAVRKEARRDCVEKDGSGVVVFNGGFVRERLDEEREGVAFFTAWSSSSRSATLSTCQS